MAEQPEQPEKPAQQAPQRARFGPDRIALIPVVVFFFGSLPVAASHGALSWVALLPVAAGVWVVRARVVAAPIGVEVCNGLRAHRTAWTDVEGFDVPKRGPVSLLRRTGRPVRMTALPRADLRRLVAVGEQAARSTPSDA